MNQEIGHDLTWYGSFISNSPVQGFAYGNDHFFIGFNDNIFQVAKNGAAQKHYRFNTKREIEGLSATNSKGKEGNIDFKKKTMKRGVFITGLKSRVFNGNFLNKKSYPNE